MPTLSRRVLLFVALVALVACFAASRTLRAHNGVVHQDLTDLAYEIMLSITPTSDLASVSSAAPPPGVSNAEWNAFMTAIRGAVIKLRSLPSGLPAPHATTCDGNAFGNWSEGKKLGELANPVALNFLTGSDCGVSAEWTPGGIFEASNRVIGPGGNGGHRDHTGNALGFWANQPDDEVDDTHLWFRPTNALGAGAVKKEIADLVSKGLAIPLIPFVCLWDCIFDDCSDCDTDAKDLADDANPVTAIEGLLPGIGDVHGLDWVGIWHHLNVRPDTNGGEFDDRPGALFETGGPFGIPDATALVLMAAFDVSGLSINYDDSRGIHRYEITGAGDGHQNTSTRSAGEWQVTTFAHLTFEPVDNLAFYGWREFRDDPAHTAKWLGWPLHAIGDATSPMHAAATSTWGHRPFEDAQQDRWRAIRHLGIPSDVAPTAAERQLQAAQMRAILAKAFEWRTFILTWRSQASGRERDVPVRELVTAVARQTLTYAFQQQTATATWPFDPLLSTVYVADEKLATGFYATDTNIARSRPLLENATAATLAFLVSASEVF